MCVVVAAIGICASAADSDAQVSMLPRTSQPAKTENYVLQVANDHQVAITRVELRIPRSVRVVSFGEKSDWPVQAFNADNKVSAAVWTGTLPPSRYTEFGFIGVNPAKNINVVWPVIITFADGEQATWWTGPTGLRAPVTLIAAVARSRGNLVLALALCVVAFLLALSALVLALRSGQFSETGFQPGAG